MLIETTEFKPDKNTTVCFSGARDIPFYQIAHLTKVLNIIIGRLYERGYRTFITGGAIGFDMMAAQVIELFKKSHTDVTSAVIMPFQNYRSKWKDYQIEPMVKICEEANFVMYSQWSYSKDAYFRRNDAMLERSNHLIAFLDPAKKTGGTFYTVHQAEKKNLTISNIHFK